MNKKIRKLLLKALKGSSKAYVKLGILFLKGKACKKDRHLAALFLQKAAEMGNEKGYLLYHQKFSKEKKVIDELSYEQMRRDYYETDDVNEKKRLKRYLRLL